MDPTSRFLLPLQNVFLLPLQNQIFIEKITMVRLRCVLRGEGIALMAFVGLRRKLTITYVGADAASPWVGLLSLPCSS
jgi:hypothetical protein